MMEPDGGPDVVVVRGGGRRREEVVEVIEEVGGGPGHRHSVIIEAIWGGAHIERVLVRKYREGYR